MNIIKIFKNRFLKQFFALILIIVAYELVIFDKEIFIWIISSFTLLFIVLLLWVIDFKVKNVRSLKSIILPFLLVISSSSYLFLIPSKQLTHLFVIAVAIFVVYFLGRVITESSRKNEFEELYNLNDIVTLVAAFLFYSSLYGFFIQLYLKPWILLITFSVFTFLLLYRFLDREKLSGSWSGLLLPVSTLVFTEIAWALIYWPIGYSIRGIVLLLIFYVYIGATKLNIEGSLKFNNMRKYIFVFVVAMGLVLGTAKWFY